MSVLLICFWGFDIYYFLQYFGYPFSSSSSSSFVYVAEIFLARYSRNKTRIIVSLDLARAAKIQNDYELHGWSKLTKFYIIWLMAISTLPVHYFVNLYFF